MEGSGSALDNASIAARLDAFASLLELAGAGPYTARAYRRAADLIRSTPAPIAELVRAGRVRELRGIGPEIERRLRELVETGEIAELEELKREVSPELAGLGRFSSASRSSGCSRSAACSASARWTSCGRRRMKDGSARCPASGRRPNASSGPRWPASQSRPHRGR